MLAKGSGLNIRKNLIILLCINSQLLFLVGMWHLVREKMVTRSKFSLGGAYWSKSECRGYTFPYCIRNPSLLPLHLRTTFDMNDNFDSSLFYIVSTCLNLKTTMLSEDYIYIPLYSLNHCLPMKCHSQWGYSVEDEVANKMKPLHFHKVTLSSFFFFFQRQTYRTEAGTESVSEASRSASTLMSLYLQYQAESWSSMHACLMNDCMGKQVQGYMSEHTSTSVNKWMGNVFHRRCAWYYHKTEKHDLSLLFHLNHFHLQL